MTPIRGSLDRYFRPIGFLPLFWLNHNYEIAGITAFRLQESRRVMNERNRSRSRNGKTASDLDLMVIAERELGAFIRAVTELFGPEQARLAAGDRVGELELMDALPGLIRRDRGSAEKPSMNRLQKVGYTALPPPLMAAWTSGSPLQSPGTGTNPSSCLPPVGPPAFYRRRVRRRQNEGRASSGFGHECVRQPDIRDSPQNGKGDLLRE